MRKLKIMILAVMACAGSLLLTMCGKDTNANNYTSEMAVRVKDAPMLHCDRIRLEIKGIKVYSSTQGWINIPVNDTVIDILQLQDTSALLSTIHLNAGIITQVVVTLGARDTVTIAGLDFVLDLVSTDIVTNVNNTVPINGVTTLVIDIQAPQSISDDDDGSGHHHYRLHGAATCDFHNDHHH